MDRPTFTALADRATSPAEVEAQAAALRANPLDRAPEAPLAAALVHVAFAAPEGIPAAWDSLARGWLGGPDPAPPVAAPAPPPDAAMPPALWPDFWAVVDDALAGRLDALAITARTAALGAHVPAGFETRLAALALAFPGVAEAAAGGIPPRFALEELAAAPAGSLGAAFHAQIVGNGYELEVLDRDALGLDSLPFPLPYVNARMLQLHDLWHLAAGYELTALHEIGISAFQMAQFGHHYSAMFLALVATIAAAGPTPGGMVPLLDTVARAWRHGRAAPPLLGLDWKALWAEPVAAVRARIGLPAFASPFPPALIETLRQAA